MRPLIPVSVGDSILDAVTLRLQRAEEVIFELASALAMHLDAHRANGPTSVSWATSSPMRSTPVAPTVVAPTVVTPTVAPTVVTPIVTNGRKPRIPAELGPLKRPGKRQAPGQYVRYIAQEYPCAPETVKEALGEGRERRDSCRRFDGYRMKCKEQAGSSCGACPKHHSEGPGCLLRDCAASLFHLSRACVASDSTTYRTRYSAIMAGHEPQDLEAL